MCGLDKFMGKMHDKMKEKHEKYTKKFKYAEQKIIK